MAKSKKTNSIPVFWFTGNYYDCSKIWKNIQSKIGDANIISHDCFSGDGDVKGSTASDVVLSLKSKDLFDSRTKIIKMNGLPEDYKILSDYLNLVSDDNVLVIDSAIGYRKRNFVSAAASTFYKEVKERGHVFNFPTELKQSEAVSWAKSVVTELNFKIDHDAAEFLINEVAGMNLDVIYGHLNKLIDYCNKNITIEDVRACCASTYLQTTWNLIDNLDKQNYDAVVEQLQKFYSNESNGFRSEVEGLLGALNFHYRLLLILKDKCDSFSYPVMKKAVEGFKKRTKTDDEYVWTDGVYEKALGMCMNSEPFKSAFQWKASHIYKVNLDLDRIRQICRRSSSVSEIKICLDTFAMVTCNKITIEQANIARGN